MITDEQIEKMLHSYGTQTKEELELARQIATETLKIYSDMNDEEWHQFEEQGIWNDHCAVQSALVAIRLMKKGEKK